MIPISRLCLSAMLIGAVSLYGCSDSDRSSSKEKAAASAPAVQSQPEASQQQTSAADQPTAQVEENANAENTTSEKPAAEKSATDPSIYEGVPLQVADISDASYDDGNAIAVTLSVPADGSQDIQSYFFVEKKNNNNGWTMTSGSWVLSDDGSIAYFDQVEPNSTYRVTVETGLPAINGETLHTPANATISFGDLQASATFASNGHFLPLDLHTGLPVYALNTPEVEVSFHRVKKDKLVRFLNWKNNGLTERYYRLDELNRFSDVVFDGRFGLTEERNKRRLLNLPVQDVEQLQTPGAYIAVMSRPGQYDDSLSVTYFTVTDIGIQLRFYDNHYDVYLNSLADPQPVADADVQLISNNGVVMYEGKSSPQGRLSIRVQKDWGQLLVARKGDSISFVSLNTPALDLSDFKLGQRPHQNRELFIYSPRDIYRGGETATFSALLRNDDGAPVNNQPLKARIIRPDGQKVKDISLQAKPGAYYQYEYALSEDAQTGDWRFEVQGVSSNTIVYKFKVEDFMPERLKMTFNPGVTGPAFFNPRQNVEIPLLGEYLYGAPAAGNRFDATVRVSPLAHPFEQYPEYFFGNAEDDGNNQQFEIPGGTLDEDGNYRLFVDSRWSNAETPLAITVTGSLYESGGRPLVRRYTARVIPSDSLIGIRPSFKEHATANSQAEFELIKTNAQGKLQAVKNARIRLINMNRRYHWRYNSSRGWYVQTTDREFNALTLSRDIDADGKTKVELPVKYGKYRIEIEDPSTGLVSSMLFNAGEDWYWYWEDYSNSEQGARPDKVSLALDKAGYDAGDVAQLKIVPPAAGESLVLVESDELLWSERVSVPAEGKTVNIPIDKNWKRHDIYVSVVHLQPADNKQRITPTRSIGLLHLPLNREPRHLQVSVDAPEKWVPDQKVVTTVKVTDNSGKAVNKAWVTLAAVDVGVLSLTDFKTPDAFDWFFSQRRYQVDLRDMYGRLIDLNNNPLAKLNYGGDADELSRGGKKARAEVQIVSLFSGQVEINNGTARIPLTLPDFNGRLRLMALAFDDDSFGNLEQEVTLAAPVVTQLSMPRFVAVGDETMVALDVTNLSGEEQNLKMNFTTSGPVTVRQPDAQNAELTLADGKKKTFILPLRAEYPAGQIDIGMTLSGNDGYKIERHWKLNSRNANPALTDKKEAMLKPGESITLTANEIKDLKPESLQALLSVSNTVNLNPRSQLEYLLHYPYGCLEQSVSSTWPWVYATSDQLASLGLKNKTGKQRSAALDSGIERIMKKQMSHGGFGLWTSHDDYEQNWLTAYAADFLTDAQDEGVRVDSGMLNKALKRLGDYLRSRATFQERWSGRPELYRQSYQAYAAYVLARHKKAPLSEIRRLAKELLPDIGQLPVLHLALAAQLQGDQALAQELLAKLKTNQRLRDIYIGDYGSDVRDTALIIKLLLRHKLDEAYAYERATQLQKTLRSRRYLSTQERNSVFMAALELERSSYKDWTGELTVQGKAQTLDKKGQYSQLVSGPAVEGMTFENTSDERLYVSLAHQGHSPLPPPPVSEGLRIQRRYFTTDGKMIEPDDGALRMEVGDLMLVQVRVSPINSYRRPDLMLIDLLPAGLELENQNLNASVKLDELMIDGHNIKYWQQESRIQHEEFRDDRYVAAFDSAYYDSTNIFYLVRAVTPGNYQVPAPLVEDMYDPEVRAVGTTPDILMVTQP